MKLVLIGGGDYGKTPDKPYNLKEIDEAIVNFSEKKHPRLLFIGFNIRANHSFGIMKKRYMELGVQCEYLSYLDFSNQKTVDGKFKRADIIYIGGGNTMYFMSKLRQYKLDEKIKECAIQGKIIVGCSAGAIIISAFGSSDSRHYKSEEKYTSAKGLGIIDIFLAPHFSGSKRPDDMPRIMKNRKKIVAIGLDDQCALFIDGRDYRIIRSNESSKAFKLFYENQTFVSKSLDNFGEFDDLIARQ